MSQNIISQSRVELGSQSLFDILEYQNVPVTVHATKKGNISTKIEHAIILSTASLSNSYTTSRNA